MKDKNFAAVILWAELLNCQIACHSLSVVLTRCYLCLCWVCHFYILHTTCIFL